MQVHKNGGEIIFVLTENNELVIALRRKGE
jgi:hypothetical protein